VGFSGGGAVRYSRCHAAVLLALLRLPAHGPGRPTSAAL